MSDCDKEDEKTDRRDVEQKRLESQSGAIITHVAMHLNENQIRLPLSTAAKNLTEYGHLSVVSQTAAVWVVALLYGESKAPYLFRRIRRRHLAAIVNTISSK